MTKHGDYPMRKKYLKAMKICLFHTRTKSKHLPKILSYVDATESSDCMHFWLIWFKRPARIAVAFKHSCCQEMG
jgi:hypothetical protein